MLNQKSMKRVGAVVSGIMLVGLLAGCGGGDGATNQAANNNSGKTTTNNKASSGTNAADTGTGNAGAKSGADYKGEFVLWTWEPEHPTALAAFNKMYPNIKMKRVNVAAGDVTKKLQTTIASGGELPDVIRIESGQKAKIFDMDVLENLEEAPYSADKSLLFDYDINAFSMGGHLVSIPDDMSIAGLAYLKPLAKEYLGTDDPKELEGMLTNWDTFIDKGKEVVEHSGGKVKMFPGLGDVYSVIKGQRAEPYFDGDKLKTPVLTNVLTDLVKFRDSGIVDKLDQWTPAWNATFAQSKYMFAMSPVWMPQYVIGANDKAEGRWGLMVPPNGGFIAGGSSHGIPKGAKNAELAWKWIEFTSMTQEGADGQKKDGVFTHYKPAYDDKAFTNWTWPSFGTQDIGAKYFVDISSTTKAVAENVNDLLLNDVMNIVLQTLAKDNTFGVDQALDKIKKELTAKEPKITFE
ncbi:ABC transporter substrate-binding protein [Paenibacillus sp. R14(2021)]|uniref:ABC transporter substrate-binding protein n=1 Tax=Paenibacillus sp. R14(2021) TaxID=2859228 RepID=UPI001C6144A5|nr:extracellular solute-binding protein [Paenibacillus sp. R14(2021)]